METASITEARANIFKIAEQAIESHEPITLTYKKGDVVMMSLEDWWWQQWKQSKSLEILPTRTVK